MKKIALFLTITAFTFACSSESSEQEEKVTYNTESSSEASEQPEMEAPATSEVKEIVIESNDMMKFNLSEIRVKAGQKIKLTIMHVGKLPKASMGHNWVLLKDGTDMQAFAQEAGQAKENDYIANEESIIAHTGLVGGGESSSVEFEAPSSGVYDFLCSFPGHYAIMKGSFIVE